MKPLPLLIACFVLALGGSIVGGLITSPGDGMTRAAASSASELALLRSQVSRLEREQGRLVDGFEALEHRIDLPAPMTAGAVSQADLERAVDAILAQREAEALAAAVDAPDAATDAAASEDALTVDGALDLLAQASDENSSHAAWKAIIDAGLLEDVIDRLQELSDADPGDTDLKLALGVAFLQKTQLSGNGPEAGVWAMKADQAFDDILALDEQHWDARFTKAVALSFWPPIFGKQSEAIRQFEVLREQQRHQTPSAGHGQTYLLLGNLYQQMGQTEKALQVWQEGAGIFPDMAELQAQIDASS